MAVPTIVSITPQSGHTGGMTLVEIVGTGFALRAPPPADAALPIPDPPPSVAVTFGGEACEPDQIGVVSSTLIRCLTPIADPGVAAVTVQNLDVDGAVVTGEIATLAAAFTFVRPDLSVAGVLSRAIRAFVQELRRQVVEEVTFAPHTDYDPDTGDAYNICKLAKLPGLALVDLKTPEVAGNGQELIQVQLDNGDFILRRPARFYDLVFTIVGVSDNQNELLNLLEVLGKFFEKNARLRVPRDPANAAAGKFKFQMQSDRANPVEFTGRQGNANVVSFSLAATIKNVPTFDMPGLPDASVPGAPPNTHAEATYDYGYPLETINVGVSSK